MQKSQPEPWLRGTHSEIPAVPRAVLHALELAQEDLTSWCGELSEQELMAIPSGLPSVAFHLRHIAHSLDRLLTYAERRQLNERQLQALTGEANSQCLKAEIFSELSAALADSSARIIKLGEQPDTLNQPRIVGRKNLPTTVAGLLVHIADHTQRHVGQAITTAKLLIAQRG
ncbi:MAG TPA: DinB family protein [Methylomirabilota bacterium]|jgi:uncharacterized damage-inducible protein DinB|nr:DinB family protein [Methylomirabilota bacterium]